MVPLYISSLCYDAVKAENLLSRKLNKYNINRELYKLNYNCVIKNINLVVNQVNNSFLLPMFYVFIYVLVYIIISYFSKIQSYVKVFIF